MPTGYMWAMKTIIQTFKSMDGKRLVEIYDHQDGFYSFEECAEAIEDIPDLGPETYWMTTYASGLYDNAGSALEDAKRTISWLRNRGG